jgi:RNA polymerase sigma factor (sigma-70 family)
VRLSDQEGRDRLERLFEAHYAAVLAYGLRRAPRGLAEDVASETFAIAFRRIADVPEEPLPWLYGVARRVLANERRAQGRRDRLDARLRAVAPPAWVEATDGARGEVLVAMARLSAPELEAVMLTAWEGLSSAEAAMAAGCSRVAMRARVSRARRRLSKLIGDDAAQAGAGGTESGWPESAGQARNAMERRSP